MRLNNNNRLLRINDAGREEIIIFCFNNFQEIKGVIKKRDYMERLGMQRLNSSNDNNSNNS